MTVVFGRDRSITVDGRTLRPATPSSQRVDATDAPWVEQRLKVCADCPAYDGQACSAFWKAGRCDSTKILIDRDRWMRVLSHPDGRCPRKLWNRIETDQSPAAPLPADFPRSPDDVQACAAVCERCRHRRITSRGPACALLVSRDGPCAQRYAEALMQGRHCPAARRCRWCRRGVCQQHHPTGGAPRPEPPKPAKRSVVRACLEVCRRCEYATFTRPRWWSPVQLTFCGRPVVDALDRSTPTCGCNMNLKVRLLGPCCPLGKHPGQTPRAADDGGVKGAANGVSRGL